MTNLATTKNPIIDEINALRAANAKVREVRLDKDSLLVSILIEGQPEKLLRAEATESLPLPCLCNEAAAYLQSKNNPRVKQLKSA